MNRIAGLSAPLALFLAAFTGPLPPPLEPANEGKLLCTKPDTEGRTCDSLIRYSITTSGTIEAHAIEALDEELLVVLEGSAPVEIKDGEVCDRTRPEHVDGYQVVMDSAANGFLTAKMYKDFFLAIVRAGQHHDLCMRFVPNGDAMIIKYIFDGLQSRLPDDPAIWVSPEDGYRVGR